jgi:hypothetical protein
MARGSDEAAKRALEQAIRITPDLSDQEIDRLVGPETGAVLRAKIS